MCLPKCEDFSSHFQLLGLPKIKVFSSSDRLIVLGLSSFGNHIELIFQNGFRVFLNISEWMRIFYLVFLFKDSNTLQRGQIPLLTVLAKCKSLKNRQFSRRNCIPFDKNSDLRECLFTSQFPIFPTILQKRSECFEKVLIKIGSTVTTRTQNKNRILNILTFQSCRFAKCCHLKTGDDTLGFRIR